MGIKLLNGILPHTTQCTVEQVGTKINVSWQEEEDLTILFDVPKGFPWYMGVRTEVSISKKGVESFALGFGNNLDIFHCGLRLMDWTTNRVGWGSENHFLHGDYEVILKKTNQPLSVTERYPFVISSEGDIYRYTDNCPSFKVYNSCIQVKIKGNPKGYCEFEAPEIFPDRRKSIIETVHWTLIRNRLRIDTRPNELNLVGYHSFENLLLTIFNLRPKTVRIYYDKILEKSEIYKEEIHILESQQLILDFVLETIEVGLLEEEEEAYGEKIKKIISTTNATNYEE